MTIEFKNLPEATVEAITEKLDRADFTYEVDFECLYGKGWAITGLVVSTQVCGQAVLDILAELAK